MSPTDVPYCGLPPSAAEWLTRWNLDPWLLAVLLLAAAAYEVALARAPAQAALRERGRPAAFRCGWALLVLAFVSPLCALAVALFSARTFQHVLLAFVAAPLLAHAWARPRPERSVRDPRVARPAATSSAAASALVFIAIFCAWHLPLPYEATFRSDAAFWAMHATILVPALAFWRRAWPAPGASGRATLDGIAALLVVMLPMGMLGAILTLAPHGLYAPHAATTASYGLAMLEDQQLGGLLMWVPAGTVLVAVAVLAAARLATAPRAPSASGNCQARAGRADCRRRSTRHVESGVAGTGRCSSSVPT